jgi:hypothetical protein
LRVRLDGENPAAGAASWRFEREGRHRGCDPFEQRRSRLCLGAEAFLSTDFRPKTWGFRLNFRTVSRILSPWRRTKCSRWGAGEARGYNRASPLPDRRRYVRR